MTVLTYRHGHFRPSIFNPLKRLFPSPLQSNWRLYLSPENPQTREQSVLFLKNIMSSPVFTLATRLASDAMLTHLPRNFKHGVTGDEYFTNIVPGNGSSPDLQSTCSKTPKFELPKALISKFGSKEKLLKYLCQQDYAFTEADDINGICKSQIDLSIDINQVIPLKVNDFKSNWLADITDGSQPFAFAIPAVHFSVLNETIV